MSASALQSFTCVLASLCICLPALDCCIRLCLAILNLSPSSGLRVACNPLHFVFLCLHLSPSSGLLWPPLPCKPLFVTQLWAALSPCVYICLRALDCCIRLCLAILYLSPSFGLHVACNPLHFVPLCLTAVAASALQSFVSQLWTSQALFAECSDFEKHKLFGVYGGVTPYGRPSRILYCRDKIPVVRIYLTEWMLQGSPKYRDAATCVSCHGVLAGSLPAL